MKEGARALLLALASTVFLTPGSAAGATPEMNVRGFSELPVLHAGRLKPIDTVARSTLLILRGKQSLRHDGRALTPAQWLLDALARPESADEYKVFVIDDPDVLGLIGREPKDGRYYSYRELEKALPVIRERGHRAQQVESAARNRFESAIARLYERLIIYHGLKSTLALEGLDDFPKDVEEFLAAREKGLKALAAHQTSGRFDREALARYSSYFERYRFMAESAQFRPLPPTDGQESGPWAAVGQSLLGAARWGDPHPGVMVLGRMMRSYRKGDAALFNEDLEKYRAWLADRAPLASAESRREVLFNKAAPFQTGMILYVAALLLAFASWALPGRLGKISFWILAAAFAVHTGGLAARVILQGRPPVTNLYSSAVFVGWAAVLGALFVERRTRKGFGTVAAGALGFCTLLIAHHLMTEGDTLEMMRAVLDSNFWLATHVVTITIGYSATFLAGILAHVYILRGALTRSLDKETAHLLYRATYGVICFALFFSFIGTALGGIWADQSWGRFWGWDPKENGALLIVLWNAIILHARWGGFVRERGVMAMAVFGNIVTSLSWFGVNMLGIGLHSYGFMGKAFVWLVIFAATQLAVMALAALPPASWGSRKALA